MKILNKILYILLFIASFVLIGVTSLFEVGFGEGTLKDPMFYIVQLMTYLAIILVTLGTIYSVIDKFKQKDTEYLKADSDIAEFAQDKRYVPSIMSKFLEDLNKKRKIKQYTFNLRRKLHKLTNYKPWYWYVLPWRWGVHKYTDKDIHIWNYGTQEEKDNNTYCKQRAYIEEQLSDEFIDKNIDITLVRYKKVTESVILGGYYENEYKKGPNDFVETNLTGKIVINKVPGLLISFGLTFLFSMIVVEAITFKTDAIISLLIKVASLMWNTYTAIRYGLTLCQTTVLRDIRFRRGIITEYDKWINQKVEEQQEAENEPREIIRTIGADNQVHTDSLQPNISD